MKQHVIPNLTWKHGDLCVPQQQCHLKPNRYKPQQPFHSCKPKHLLAQHLSQNIHSSSLSQLAFHVCDDNRKKLTVDQLINGPDAYTRWMPALSNEWGRLAQGNNAGVQATDTLNFIPFSQVPSNKLVTHATFACDHRPLKSEPWRICLVVGGN